MSNGPAGGYALFPSTLLRTDLIAITTKAMELGPAEFQVGLFKNGVADFDAGLYPIYTKEPPEQALTLLAQEECGVIEGRGSKSAETYWFEPAAASYHVVTIWIEQSAMRYDKQPEEVEHFVARWLQLCEQGHAVFGYICPFDFMFEREYLDEKILPALQSDNVRRLLEQIDPGWLIYLGPELAERWRAEQSPSPSSLLSSQDLPSGAQFFRISKAIDGD